MFWRFEIVVLLRNQDDGSLRLPHQIVHYRRLALKSFLTSTLLSTFFFLGRQIINYEKQALQVSNLQLCSSAMYLSRAKCPSL